MTLEARRRLETRERARLRRLEIQVLSDRIQRFGRGRGVAIEIRRQGRGRGRN